MIDQVEGLAKVKKNYPNHSLHFAIDLCHLCIKLTRALIVDDRVKPSYWESEIFPTGSSYRTVSSTEQRKIGLKSSTSVDGTDFGIPNTLYFFKALKKFSTEKIH